MSNFYFKILNKSYLLVDMKEIKRSPNTGLSLFLIYSSLTLILLSFNLVLISCNLVVTFFIETKQK
jgi:hypothetical protein